MFYLHMHCAASMARQRHPWDCPFPAHLKGCPTLLRTQTPISASLDCQPLALECHSRVGVQLPIALPAQPRALLSQSHLQSLSPGHSQPTLTPGGCLVTMAVVVLVPPASLLPAAVLGQSWLVSPGEPPGSVGPNEEHIWTASYFKWNSCQTQAGFGMSIKLDIGNSF